MRRQEEEACYEEAQSRLRLSMTCSDLVRPLGYPLFPRIVELALRSWHELVPRRPGEHEAQVLAVVA